MYNIVMIAPFTEWINGTLAANWKAIASKNYFDTNGAFITAVFAAPLIGNAFLILIMLLLRAADLLIIVKRRQLAQAQKKKE